AIGRAIVREPRVFLFDEPLSNLDAKLRGHMRAELALLHERLAKTTVYVTHDQIEAMTLADRIVIFDKGRIQQVGTPGEVFNRPATLFVAAFIGMPGMNLLSVRFIGHEGSGGLLRGNGFELPAPGWLRDRVTSPGQPLTVGIRPQALRIASERAPLNLRVDVVEYLGTESQVVGHLATAGGARITATVQGDAHGLLHTTVGLTAGTEDMHVFDTASGQSLRP
ncbi:ATPase component of ABC-type sugar transporter, partial [Variovorax sp. CF313]|uniref:ABC transporter ATP-binding protein n=1 Tax=Variovorax sp. CF313 TaxID=1144315 RepID=UPI00027102F3